MQWLPTLPPALLPPRPRHHAFLALVNREPTNSAATPLLTTLMKLCQSLAIRLSTASSSLNARFLRMGTNVQHFASTEKPLGLLSQPAGAILLSFMSPTLCPEMVRLSTGTVCVKTTQTKWTVSFLSPSARSLLAKVKPTLSRPPTMASRGTILT